eukprot:TRINITY_DN4524_c0_g1_i2.p1 TRINITY_DN4524_c0_g1~~TRINITY_DN4524_c0_g1_i2.p1  ORF type:complete len:319 (-),score=68.26 TRINITY_DN4524_c0_g1_i2:93-1049(-)
MVIIGFAAGVFISFLFFKINLTPQSGESANIDFPSLPIPSPPRSCNETLYLSPSPIDQDFEIDVVHASSLTLNDFYRHYVATSTPVIIKGVVPKWKAYTDWNSAYLVNRIGKKFVFADVSSDNVFNFYGDKWILKNMTYKEFNTKCNNRAEKKKYYLAAQVIPELEGDVSLPQFATFLDPDVTLFWMGCGGQLTPIHNDPLENLMGIVQGEKEFLIFHPSERELIYPIQKPRSPVLSSQIDDFNAVDLESYPLYRKAHPIRFTLRAGEMLYLPSYWWHQVTSLGNNNIAVNYWFHPSSSLYSSLIESWDEKHLGAKGK